MIIRAVTILAVAGALLAGAPGASAARLPGTPAPQGFVGMNIDGPVLSAPIGLDSELGTMVGAGVESVRVLFSWAGAQPYANFAQVPADQRSRFADEGGVPTDWSFTDGIVRAAAMRRLSVLPILLLAPPWAARHPGLEASPPSSPAPFARFAAAAVRRYGPRGSFWKQNPGVPRVPIREWQVWNEPHFTVYWSDQPFVKDYVALLKATYRAVKKADHGARIVIAGMTSRSWVSYARLYKAGARRWFDVAAVHPFSLQIGGVLRILRNVRLVMTRNHDQRKPMFITETSWPSALGKIPANTSFGYEVTEPGQAERARNALRAFTAARRVVRLARVYWYTWMTPDTGTYPFNYSGLERFTGSAALAKPALRAFRATALKIEGCRSKRRVATSCRR